MTHLKATAFKCVTIKRACFHWCGMIQYSALVNKFNIFFGLNLTLVYTFLMCMAWPFHFPIRKFHIITIISSHGKNKCIILPPYWYLFIIQAVKDLTITRLSVFTIDNNVPKTLHDTEISLMCPIPPQTTLNRGEVSQQS